MQGGQGSGKTTLCAQLERTLSSPPHSLRVATLSLDDLYLPREQLDALARRSRNPLLSGRGQAGTHDLSLARQILDQVKNGADSLELPLFDKSLHSGKGDRSASARHVSGPLDIFVLEGWSMGFAPLSEGELQSRYNEANAERSYYKRYAIEHLRELNHNLSQAADAIYPYFHAFVQLRASKLDDIFLWRIEQEHSLLAAKGAGMSDEQVKLFVERYMPGYELWSGGITSGRHAAVWRGRGIALLLDAQRSVLSTESF
ncbi:uncharacterized protein L969DRAFT_97391 [Mixia osmundae IAM 14324]|uniref:Phosphoribulokinase/uridine kinase domain-containing protein n=1 Tax=Mixia osmundae (strain CBS 9802 / IAM 14324 / JCM 22182 / KY 12970) TaxID=764103 RepID=G7DUM5_MIXOS|nr:uncharacterized protein L969DRAFT_97391 [Mixia osmundae IAM 14324]KEI36381.1 hypothetical protein L969DRAFT_97391 [Mixia osmundae IAM 14324]GAA94285.1 hypothetical protein E5Q_00934 [Mixia osmundae IAM 14324]